MCLLTAFLHINDNYLDIEYYFWQMGWYLMLLIITNFTETLTSATEEEENKYCFLREGN